MSLSEFLSQVEGMNELRRVPGANLEEEIGALAELNAREPDPTAMLFERIPGFDAGRVVTGLTSSPRRLSAVFGHKAETLDEILQLFRGGRVRRWVDDSPKFRPTDEARPAHLSSAECSPDGINVQSFPAPKWHADDGGPYLGTGGYVLTTDLEGTWVNAGAYRLQVHGPNQLSLYLATSRHGRQHLQTWWDAGRPAPVVAVIGDHPLLPVLAGVEIPAGVSELDVAGAVRGEPLSTFRGELTNIPIPTTVELAMEGFLHEGNVVKEGPFGEGTGYYSDSPGKAPLIDVERIYYREDPIVLGAQPGIPPHDYSFVSGVVRSAMIQDAVEAAGVTGIKGVWQSVARGLIVISVKQSHPGHGRQAAMVAAHCGPGAYMSRYIIAVDEDIDPTDYNNVIWAVVTRADPASAIEIVRKGWGSPVDPLAAILEEGHAYNNRAIIDACVPFTKKHLFPKVVETHSSVLDAVRSRFADSLKRP